MLPSSLDPRTLQNWANLTQARGEVLAENHLPSCATSWRSSAIPKWARKQLRSHRAINQPMQSKPDIPYKQWTKALQLQTCYLSLEKIALVWRQGERSDTTHRLWVHLTEHEDRVTLTTRMWTAADPDVSMDHYRPIICCKNETFLVKSSWVGNSDTLLHDCYYSLCPNCSFLYLVGFPTPWRNTMHQPALPSLMLLQCHTRLKNRLSFTQTGRLIQAAEPAKAPTMSSHSHLCRPPAKTELQVRSLRSDRRADASVNTYKLTTVLYPQSTLPMHKASYEGLDILAVFPQSETSCTCKAQFCWHTVTPQQRQSWTGWYFSTALMSIAVRASLQNRCDQQMPQASCNQEVMASADQLPQTHTLRGKYLLNNSSRHGRLSGQLHM